MYWDVIQVQSIAPRELAVQFADGSSGVVRIDASFCTGVFNPLLDDQVVGSALNIKDIQVSEHKNHRALYSTVTLQPH